MIIESNNKLPLVQEELFTCLLAFDEISFVREAENADEQSVTLYTYTGARVEKPLTYDKVVSVIINDAYSQDKQLAILYNHLLDDGNLEHEKEYSDFQNWRAHAKEIAKQIFAKETEVK